MTSTNKVQPAPPRPLTTGASREAITSTRFSGLYSGARQKLAGKHTYGTKAIMLRVARLDADGDSKVTPAELDAQRDEIVKMCETIQTNWTNSGVISALILSLAIPFLFEGPLSVHESLTSDSVADALQLTYAIMLTICVACSFMSMMLALVMCARAVPRAPQLLRSTIL